MHNLSSLQLIYLYYYIYFNLDLVLPWGWGWGWGCGWAQPLPQPQPQPIHPIHLNFIYKLINILNKFKNARLQTADLKKKHRYFQR